MTEPLFGGSEPVGGNPIGESGMPIGIAPTEPEVSDVTEPVSADEYEDVDFEDLKNVPPQFAKVAKKLQASYTKKMQALSSIEKMLPQTPSIETPIAVDPNLVDAKAKVMGYMASSEGAALKEVFESLVNEKLGTLPQEVQQQKVEREVSQVMQKYGEDVINQNYDEIEAAAKANKNIPLDYIVANVLFAKAKELGANEYKSKITRKSEFSDAPRGSASNVISKKAASSFEEAFEAAQSSTGV